MAGLKKSTEQTAIQSKEVELLVQLLKLSSFINGPMQDGVASPNNLALNELKITLCLGGEGALAGHDIADIMGIAPMNVSRSLSSLLQRGWIEPVEDPGSRRRKPFRLSRLGWESHSAMLPDLGDVAVYLLGKLSAKETAKLLSISEKVVDRMADWLEDHHAGLHVRHSSKG
jgi:DNA-binding MarR family transcriptional regulator